MAMAAPNRVPSLRGERTRSAILRAAEALFAERGFEATRLEDVAAAVGIRRASIVYYFRDKRALYDAVLEEVLEALRVAIAGALSARGAAAVRVVAAVAAWIEFLGERPTFGRLLLRELASAAPTAATPALANHLSPFFDLVRRFQDEGAARGDTFADAIEPAHFASAIAGATVFYASALPALVPGVADAAEDPEASANHRAVVLSMTQRLLGVREDPPPKHSKPQEETIK